MISNLQGLDTFKSLLDKDEHFFAPSLCNLLCAIKKNEELWHATNEKALAEENEDRASLNAKEAELLKALKTDHAKVEQYCEEHNILMPIGFMGSEGINEFRAYEQGKIVSAWHIIDSLIQAHINALSNLVNIDLEFVKQFAFVNEKGAITALKIHLLIDEWEVEKKALARKQIGTFWYAWKQLTRFHETYHDFECLRPDALKQGKLFREWELCEDLKRIESLNSSKGDLYKKELQFYAKKILYELEQFLRQITHQKKPFRSISYEYDPVKQEGCLFINNQEDQKRKVKSSTAALFLKAVFEDKTIDILLVYNLTYSSNKKILSKEEQDRIYSLKTRWNTTIISFVQNECSEYPQEDAISKTFNINPAWKMHHK